MEYQSVVCPWCGIENNFESLNCSIFRCGIYTDTGQQINPHLGKEECDKLFSVKSKEDRKVENRKKIYGCAKPYKVVKNNNYYIALKCDYI